MKFRILNGISGFAVLAAAVFMSTSVMAATDVEVYSSSKAGGGVTVATFDASGQIVDEQLVLAGQQVVGVQPGQPVPQPTALTADQMQTGSSSISKLNEASLLDEANKKLDDLKQRIS